MGRMDIADRMRPQDGRARMSLDGRHYDLRISVVPTRGLEKAVIRVLDTGRVVTLEGTGMRAADLVQLRAALDHRDGIFVVTGPTGSGKTTTLYGALREIATEDLNVMTVEDPVEYELPGLTQIQVERKQGVTFASALRAILRQDPDVIFVGEIRDLETAEVAAQASLTGHLVLATLHTNDAVGSIRRFVDLGLDAATIAETLRGALAQRLVRRVCPHCSVPATPPSPESEQRLQEVFGIAQVVRARGCDKCVGQGYLGRLPVTELMMSTPALVKRILEGAAPEDVETQAIHDGMIPLLESALERVRKGETTLEEISRVLGVADDVIPPTGDDAGEPDTDTVHPGPGEDGGRAAAVDVSDPIEEAPDRSGQSRILIVDDDGTNRSITRALLERHGYEVAEASDGSEGLARLARGEPFSLMVLDLDMPMLGGRDVLRVIRGSMATAGLPVVVLTGTQDPNAEADLMEAGADDYIAKPIEPPVFMSRVRAALRRAGLT
jgi:Tfp pilus assembly pilus retraction ATPase PilT/CheY-like chemotaxis protein